ncbi:MAG TPA: DsbE family thiol:disulfide interchange protein [Acidiferrobacteraceae bacterium]|nr:DsbE family thiol:disulfide interchange protein [Acidiferrobacteraceae bacterium]
MKKFFIPVLLLIGLGVLLARGLTLNPSYIPSPLINKPLPAFTLPTLFKPSVRLTNASFQGQVVLFNVWASWCVSCREEHPVLVALARLHAVPIIGLDYKDHRKDALATLARLGNPYQQVLMDRSGMTGINWGIYGVPETFVVDRHGIIRHKFVGPLSPALVEQRLLPLVAKLNREP